MAAPGSEITPADAAFAQAVRSRDVSAVEAVLRNEDYDFEPSQYHVFRLQTFQLPISLVLSVLAPPRSLTPAEADEADNDARAIVGLLVDCGVDVSVPLSADKHTILHMAAAKNFGWRLLRYLVRECGADPDAQTGRNFTTPLHKAVMTRSNRSVDALLSLGADQSLKDRFKRTPLESAIRTNVRDVVKTMNEWAARQDVGAYFVVIRALCDRPDLSEGESMHDGGPVEFPPLMPALVTGMSNASVGDTPTETKRRRR